MSWLIDIKKTHMILFLKFITLVLCSILIHCAPSDKKPIPKAVKGVLDLRDWDFEKDGNVNLDGEWEFYWKELPVGESLELPEEKRDYLGVPRPWNGHIIKRTTSGGEPFGEILGSEGYATYRLRVLLKDEVDVGLRVPDEATSYELYVKCEILKKYIPSPLELRDYEKAVEIDKMDSKKRLITPGFLLTFSLVTSLFFLWALPNTMNDILIPHFMKSLELSRFKAGLIFGKSTTRARNMLSIIMVS
jgi:hypothetical protein